MIESQDSLDEKFNYYLNQSNEFLEKLNIIIKRFSVNSYNLIELRIKMYRIFKLIKNNGGRWKN